MTNRVALILALLIGAGILADSVLTGGEGLTFLARKFIDLLDWVAFWR